MSDNYTERMWVEYGKYLGEIVYSRKYPNRNRLLKVLHDIPFVWEIEFDENRALDGYDLRYRFCEDNQVIFVRDSSVLEVLVALAIRIDNEYLGDGETEHPEIIFWEMLENLGIGHMYDRILDEKIVLYAIKIWMNRSFKSDGKGSIFPLKHTSRDQRELEIWTQMQEYLNERYRA